MSWWHYLLLVNFYLVLFFGFYTAFLRRETFFQLNRVYLVIAAIVSFLIPIIKTGWISDLFITQQLQTTIINYTLPVITISANASPVKESLSISEIALGLYLGVVVILFIRLVIQLVIVNRMIANPRSSVAYSFFKKIKVDDTLSDHDIINRHEEVHAREWHSADVLLIELIAIINWFNPVIYLYRRAIKHVHEFIADNQVIQSGTDKADYASLLFEQTFHTPINNLITPFYNHTLLKQRIIMIQKNRSQRTALLKYSFAVPLFALMLVLSSATINNFQVPPPPQPPKPVNKKVPPPPQPPKSVKSTSKGNVFIVTEILPSFPGGPERLNTFLAKNIKYPVADREANTQGKAIVQYIVEPDGSLTNFKVVRAATPAMGAEAVRVLKLSPKWKPGLQNGKPVRAQFTQQVAYTLQEE